MIDTHLGPGQVHIHPEHGLIYIVDGCYSDATYGRWSNWWRWKKIGSQGILCQKVQSGYGGKWPRITTAKIEIKVTL